MSRRKRAHQIVDQVVDQAEALVEQVAPHVEAARDRVVTEYVPQARAALDDARGSIASAAATAAAKSPVGPKPKKKRGRTVLKLLVLAGIGTAIGTRLRSRNVSPAAMYEAPEPAPTVPPQPNPTLETDPVPPGAIGEHNPEPEDLARLEDEAPLPDAEPPADSLSSFFSDVEEPARGSRRR